MSEVTEGLTAILSGNAFANAFWVFIGVVAGAFIQFFLGMLNQRTQRRNAERALETEIELNLSQFQALQSRFGYLRERISAGQIDEKDLFLTMQGFDYSIVNPLIASGHFHVVLGHENVTRYFNFMKFFNNKNAELLNSMLRTEHEKAKSLDYLTLLEKEAGRVVGELTFVKNTVGRGSPRLYSPPSDKTAG